MQMLKPLNLKRIAKDYKSAGNLVRKNYHIGQKIKLLAVWNENKLKINKIK